MFPPRAVPAQGDPSLARDFQELPGASVCSQEAVAAAPHNGLSPLQSHHCLHCVSAPRGQSCAGAELGQSWGAAPQRVPNLSHKEWHGQEERLLGKSTVCMDLLGTVALRGQDLTRSGIFPAHSRGTCNSEGFTSLWGPSFLSWVTQSLQNLIHSGASLNVTCKCRGGRGGIGTDASMGAPGFVQRLCQTKGLLGGCLWLQGWG